MNISENIERSSFYYDNSQNVYGGNTKCHYHENIEIYFLQSGECSYFIDNRVYSLQKGDILLIPSGQIHQTNYKKGVHSRQLINCNVDYVPDDIFDEIFSVNYLFRAPELAGEIGDIFKMIEQEYLRRDDYSDKLIKNYVNRLFYIIARYKKENISSISENKLVEEVIKYIKDNYMNEISLFEVARINAISGEHLSRVFKKETGRGFNEYVSTLRLERAEFMLKNEEGKAVSEIAFACGFNDSNYFSYRFKKAYGISPSKIKTRLSQTE